MRILPLAALLASTLAICLANIQIDKDGLDDVADLTNVRMDHFGTDHTPSEKQEPLTLPPSAPATAKDQIAARLVEWQRAAAEFLEQHFPRQVELIRHVRALSLQAKKENKELGGRAVVLTYDDIYNDLRRLVPWLLHPQVRSDSITRRRAIADTIKHLRPLSLQHDASVLQVRLLHWTTDAAERTAAATHQLSQYYYNTLNQLSNQCNPKHNETLTESATDDLNALLVQTWSEGSQLTKEVCKRVDEEFAKLVWLSGPLRPWLEELNTATLNVVAQTHKDAMYSAVSRVRKLIINSIGTGPQELSEASLAVETSKIRAERAFVEAGKQLKKVWENAASEIRASPWTTPYWEDVVKDTVVATKTQVLGIKGLIQGFLARLAGCNCRQ